MNEALSNTLSDLALKLGRSVESLWPSAVRYVAIDAASTIVFMGLLAGLSVFFGVRWWHRLGDSNDQYDVGMGRVAIVIALSVIFTIVFVSLSNAVPALIDPEGALVRKLLLK